MNASASAVLAPVAEKAPAVTRAPRSMIAGANALMRMKESARRGARILDDPWAGALAEGHWLVQSIRYARFALPPLWRAIDELQTAHCVRHRAIDELVLRAIEADGFRQVVVIGAGYDMRPSRFQRRLSRVRWIEVDLPGTGERKQRLLERLTTAGGTREFAAVDLNAGTLAEALRATHFDPKLPTVFVLEGLIHYLPADRLDALLHDLGAGPHRRRVLVSFIRPEVYAKARGPLVWMVRALREIPRLTFAPLALAGLCERHGFHGFHSWTFDEQVTTFAPEARGRRVGATQDVAQVDR